MKYLILLTIVAAIIGAPLPVKKHESKCEIIIIRNFHHNKMLQDAGDFDKQLDPAIQRKMKSIKWGSAKYE